MLQWNHSHVFWEFESFYTSVKFTFQGMRRVGAQFIVHLPNFLSPTQPCTKVSSLPTPGQKGGRKRWQKPKVKAEVSKWDSPAKVSKAEVFQRQSSSTSKLLVIIPPTLRQKGISLSVGSVSVSCASSNRRACVSEFLNFIYKYIYTRYIYIYRYFSILEGFTSKQPWGFEKTYIYIFIYIQFYLHVNQLQLDSCQWIFHFWLATEAV